MPGLRHQDVQDRQGLAVISQVSEKAGYLPLGYPAFLLPVKLAKAGQALEIYQAAHRLIGDTYAYLLP